ncbi:hypothetical protein [Marinobacterium stanieri]|uniref:hypothetical protein n=1 Tax=Marinobacterium stanieri TaxID=49186 RepID=UPI000255A637|nr:hypothetical protein [Marinobacterium stanieri]
MLKDDDDKRKLAELIKHLSDYGSSLKILIVGISDTGRNLVCNHRSLERCVNEISLQPILITALRDIIIKGSKRLGIIFHDDVIDDIVDISGGYPHFIHLIALKCAEEAIAIGSDKILPQDLEGSLSLAANFSEGGLKRNYEEAIKKNTKNSKKVLLAASLCHPKGFLVSELVEMTKEAIDPELKKSIITSCLSRWVKDESLGIILKVGRGHYKFSDPRFMSYIKMVNGITFDEGLLIADSLKNEYSKRYISNH